MAARVAVQTSGTFRTWASFAAIVGGVALAFDLGAALAAPEDRELGVRSALGLLGLLAGLLAFGAACVARAYRVEGDGQVSSRKRFALGCLAPLTLAAALLLAWVFYLLWLVPEHLRLWVVVGAPLAGAVERLSNPVLGRHSSGSREKSTS